MKSSWLVAITLLILFYFAESAYSADIKVDNNSEITIDDVLIKDHQITDTAQNCFTKSCAYDIQVKNKREMQLYIQQRGYSFAGYNNGVGIAIFRH